MSTDDRAQGVPAGRDVARDDARIRPTRAEVDLDVIASNFRRIREVAGGAAVLPIIKADAYGHGALPVARRLVREGAIGFGVALAEEAIELREAGVASRLLVLDGVYPRAHRSLVCARITPVVFTAEDAEAFEEASLGARVPIHVKVDTGMSRLGVPARDLTTFLDALARCPSLVVEGVMTHLASADDDPEFTRVQLARFGDALDQIRARGHRPTIVHAANSAGTLLRPDARFDLVRPGIALYGHSGSDVATPGLATAMTLRSALISVRTIGAGESVGYGGTFRASRESRIATVPIGYADGYFRALSNRGVVLVRGTRCPVAGRVSMDLLGVDVTDVASAIVGDEVVLLGKQQGAEVTVEELARAAGTVPYEIFTNVSRRVPRVYLGGD